MILKDRIMRKLLQALSLGAAILLTSCSQDKGEETLTNSVAKPVSVKLSIEADLDDEALRSSLRSLKGTFNKDNNWRPEIAELTPGSTVALNLVFSNGKTAPIHRNDITFTVNKEGKLRYEGQINVPGYNISDKWYVTAIYGGAFNGSTSYGYAPQMYKVDGNHEFVIGTAAGGLNIPYMSGWTPVEGALNSQTKAAEGYFKVKLRPMGYLLRIQVENRRDHKVAIKRFEPATAGFYLNADFTVTNTPQALEQGAYPTPVERPNGNGNEGNGRFVEGGAGIELERGDKTPTKSAAFLVWVMAKDKITANTTVKFNAIHYKQGAEWKFPFSLKLSGESEAGVGGFSGLKTLVLPNDHKIYRKLYDIDYVALGNMGADGKEVAEGVAGYSNTYAQYNTNYRTGGIARYGTDMTPENWSNILPKSSNGTYLGDNYDGASNSDGWVYFNGGTGAPTTPRRGDQLDGNYTRSVVGGNYVIYAIRTLPSPQMPGKKGAFRYAMDANGNLTVEMVHLDGTYNNSPAIGTVASESYWSTARQYGEVVKRVFPVADGVSFNKDAGPSVTYGYTAVRSNGNGAGILWNRGSGRVGINLDINIRSTIQINSTLKRQVRLMKDTPEAIHANP